jgi:hypothetical protein
MDESTNERVCGHPADHFTNSGLAGYVPVRDKTAVHGHSKDAVGDMMHWMNTHARTRSRTSRTTKRHNFPVSSRSALILN